jgi:hypothetical protein
MRGVSELRAISLIQMEGPRQGAWGINMLYSGSSGHALLRWRTDDAVLAVMNPRTNCMLQFSQFSRNRTLFKWSWWTSHFPSPSDLKSEQQRVGPDLPKRLTTERVAKNQKGKPQAKSKPMSWSLRKENSPADLMTYTFVILNLCTPRQVRTA